MKSCLIITGGSMDLAFAGSFLKDKDYDKVIAVDAGLEAVLKLGLKPDAVVGDFDTVKESVLERFRSTLGIDWEEHKPEKDETDTELAILTAMRYGCGSVTILGATGGRMDHTLGNIHLLYPCLKQGIDACIIDSRNKVFLLDCERVFKREQQWGTYISFLPLTWEVKGITLTGFKYPLQRKDISVGTSLCISNELTGEEGTISLTDGILICVESHD